MDSIEERILDVAKKEFERFGFKKTTLDEIAKRARISKKSIYQHFASKEELFIRVITREAGAARAEMLKRLSDVSDPLERLQKFAMIGIKYFHEKPFIVNLINDDEGVYLPFLDNKFIVEAENEAIEILSRILQEGIEKGVIRPLDKKVVSYILIKIFQEFTYTRSGALPSNKKNRSHEVKELLDFLTRAIAQ